MKKRSSVTYLSLKHIVTESEENVVEINCKLHKILEEPVGISFVAEAFV